MYKIEVSPSADRDLKKLTSKIQSNNFYKLRDAIRSLKKNPKPYGLKKIKGMEDVYRIRVGNHRIIYKLYDKNNLVLLLKVVRRDENTYKM